jgi:hypothetical protein
MNTSRWVSTCLLIALALLPGCNRTPWVQTSDTDDALKKLGSTIPAPEYGHDFWETQRVQQSDAWQQAVKLCGESILAAYPNCLPVNGILEGVTGKSSSAQREKNARFNEMTHRGYDYDAGRGLWFRETDMVGRKCYYMPLNPNSPQDFRSTFQCPPGTNLPKGEK